MYFYFIVDGHWSQWSKWSGCSASCGGGTTFRERQCDNPPPDPDGNNCAGHNNETQTCNAYSCPGMLYVSFASRIIFFRPTCIFGISCLFVCLFVCFFVSYLETAGTVAKLFIFLTFNLAC